MRAVMLSVMALQSLARSTNLAMGMRAALPDMEIGLAAVEVEPATHKEENASPTSEPAKSARKSACGEDGASADKIWRRL